MMFKGWGFCHSACQKSYDIWRGTNKLRMVKLTTFPDVECKELGNMNKTQLNGEAVVNIRKELCGGHLDYVNTTVVNYTKRATEER